MIERETDYRYRSTFLNGEKVNWLATIGNPSVTPSDVYSYGYSLDGRRTGKANYTTKVRYLYDGTNVAYENWSDGTHVRYTHPLAGYGMEDCGSCGEVCGPTSNVFVDHPISMTQDGQKYYYLYDGLGSVTEVIDLNQKLLNQYRYTPFGEPRVKVETVHNPYEYAGRRYDDESGKYYYRARQYSTKQARFMSIKSMTTYR